MTLLKYCQQKSIIGGEEGMKLSTELLTLTEKQINNAFEKHDLDQIQKETLFILNNLALSLPEAYSNIIDNIKLRSVKLRTEPGYLLKESYIASLKKFLNVSAQIYNNKPDFTQIKFDFDSWFYDITSDGVLSFDYVSETLLSITDAANELNVSRQMIYKYIDRGLETVGEKGSQKIPRVVMEVWKNPAYAFKMQWIYQLKKARTQTLEEKLEFINKQITEFEKEYGGTFYNLFGSLNNKDIDGLSEAVDIFDWKELEQNKQQILEKISGKADGDGAK